MRRFIIFLNQIKLIYKSIQLKKDFSKKRNLSGWNDRTRTCALQSQNLVPYQLGYIPKIFTIINYPFQRFCQRQIPVNTGLLLLASNTKIHLVSRPYGGIDGLGVGKLCCGDWAYTWIFFSNYQG